MNAGTEFSEKQAMHRLTLLMLGLAALGLLVAGCGKSLPPEEKPVAVSGTVTLLKKPITYATIEFSSKTSKKVRSASVIDGKFSLAAVQGLPPGDYSVRLVPYEADIEEFQSYPVEKRQAIVASRKTLPKGYGRDGALTATLSATTPNELTFDLRP